MHVIKYFPMCSKFILDAFSRKKQIPNVGTIVIDEILGSPQALFASHYKK